MRERRTRQCALSMLFAVTAAGMLLAGCGRGAHVASTTRHAAKHPFTVTSTLDTRRVLPHRIHWVALPSLPAADIAQVAFLVDGKIAWIEHTRPYSFSDDGGSLVTSWIRPGAHSFTVRAVATDGRTATDTVKAQVSKPAAPPAALAGAWSRRIDASNAPPAGGPQNPTSTFTPSGVYRLVVDAKEIQTRFPGRFIRPASDNTGDGWILDTDYTAGPGRLGAQGAVSFQPFDQTTAEGGWWCYPGGPPANYSWSVSGRTLTLKPLGAHDACGVRGFIWTGRWERG